MENEPRDPDNHEEEIRPTAYGAGSFQSAEQDDLEGVEPSVRQDLGYDKPGSGPNVDKIRNYLKTGDVNTPGNRRTSGADGKDKAAALSDQLDQMQPPEPTPQPDVPNRVIPGNFGEFAPESKDPEPPKAS